jgi:hypothetical protein
MEAQSDGTYGNAPGRTPAAQSYERQEHLQDQEAQVPHQLTACKVWSQPKAVQKDTINCKKPGAKR